MAEGNDDAGPVTDTAVLEFAHLTGVKITPRKGDNPAYANVTVQVLLTEGWTEARGLLDEAMRLDQSLKLIIQVAQPTFAEAMMKADD